MKLYGQGPSTTNSPSEKAEVASSTIRMECPYCGEYTEFDFDSVAVDMFDDLYTICIECLTKVKLND